MISEHISYKEATYSQTGVRRGFDNTPNDKQLKCMEEVAENLFEPLREWVGGPIKVNSFFRGEQVNTAIGGEKSSYIKDNLDFDQMVWEFGTEHPDGNPNWIHISWVSHRPNRKKLTIAKTINGRTKYIHI